MTFSNSWKAQTIDKAC